MVRIDHATALWKASQGNQIMNYHTFRLTVQVSTLYIHRVY